MPELYALILSGGAGTRLWPRSRRSRPKQFLDLLGDGRTLFAATLARLDPLIDAAHTFVVAPPDHAPLVRRDAPAVPEANLITEPYPRGNAPAIGLALAVIASRHPDAVVAVLPSDHVIEEEGGFRDCLAAARDGAAAGFLVTLGVTPTAADTGFGYIERTAEVVAPGVYRVRRFVEKPRREAAEQMVRTGTHLWNAGMFVFSAGRALDEYERHLPKTGAAIAALLKAAGTQRFPAVLADAWEETEQTTFDYGVMEKADRVGVVPADIGWHDVGNWSRLADIVLKRDSYRPKTLLGEGSRGVYVYSPEKVVAVVGVEDLVVIETEDALLVCQKERAEEVKAIVERLQREGRTDLL
jgi:mannose-1-phosphate guanylyltransferase